MRWALLFLACCSAGCFWQDMCHEECEPPPPSCDGACAPFVGAGWSPVLVASSSPRPRCPSVAPVQAMATGSMTVCGVPEGEGECNDGLVCLEASPGWTACVVRDGAHACPTFYELPVAGEDGATLCCPSEEPPS